MIWGKNPMKIKIIRNIKISGGKNIKIKMWQSVKTDILVYIIIVEFLRFYTTNNCILVWNKHLQKKTWYVTGNNNVIYLLIGTADRKKLFIVIIITPNSQQFPSNKNGQLPVAWRMEATGRTSKQMDK
jgi:hypothetical protein